MTVANLFAKHREGEVTRDKFLIEVRKDPSLPWITNLTSYDDAVQILKNKGLVKEAVSSDYLKQYENRYFFDENGKKFLVSSVDAGNVYIKYPNSETPTTYKGNFKEDLKDGVIKTARNIEEASAEGGKPRFKVDRKYTHFAIGKNDNKIVTGWDYKGLDNEDIKHYSTIDLKDMDLKPADYRVVSGTFLNKKGIDPFNWDSWKKHVNESKKSSKKVIKENEDLYLTIDRMNPIIVQKATNHELAKLTEINPEIYKKTQEKVVKKLQQNPHAYDDLFISNAKEIEKIDSKRKMVPVKKELKDPHHQMKSPKSIEKHKENTKSSNKENKKGKPKGVNEMPSHAKGHKGVEQMKQPEKKHKVMESLVSLLFKKKITEDVHHKYGVGQSVKTPDGEGTVRNIVGGTVSVELGDDKIKDYQINVLDYMADKGNKLPHTRDTVRKFDHTEPTIHDKKDEVIKKVLELLKKNKKKKSRDIDEDQYVGPSQSNIDNINKTPLSSQQKQTAINSLKKGQVVNV